MPLSFPKNRDVIVRSNRDLEDLVTQLSQTIRNHLQYVEDDATDTCWNKFQSNSIDNPNMINLMDITNIL